MAYKVYLNNNLFFDSSLQTDDVTLTRANVNILASGSGSFNFVIPPQHKDYNNLHRLTDYLDVYRDDELLWSGRIYSITDQYDGQKAVSCEGLLSVLADTIYRPETFQGELQDLVYDILDSHNEQVENAKKIQLGQFTVDNSAVYRDYVNYETSISRLKDLLNSFGGYMSVRKSNGQLYLDWIDHFTVPCTQRIELSSNLTDIKKTINSDGIFTMLIPLGAKGDNNERLTIKSVNSDLDYITASSSVIAEHGYIMQTKIWDDVHSAALLKSKAITYLQASLTPKYEISLSAVDLADAGFDVDSFRVGQMITVYSQPHGIEGLQFACTEQSVDLLDPSQNHLDLGEVRVGFVESSRNMSADQILEKTAQDIERSRESLEQEIATATATITGNAGGYVVMHDSDNDTLPDEILVMDTPDIDTAVKVWRWNNAGLGYSSTGYEGPYGLAMYNGMIVADYIRTGTLNANLLKAGIIRGQQGNSYWDLNTGVLHIEGSGDVDKSKVFIYEPTPPYYVGDLWVTQRDDSSGVVGYLVAGYGIVGNTASGEGGKIMTCIYTRLDGSFNEDDWSLITNYVSDNDLQILEQRVSTAELNISANTATIQTKASQETLDYLGNRVEIAESSIEQNAHDITLKVSEEDVTGNYVIGKINLSSTTATIAASHINLQGAVTISSFDSTTQGKVVTNTTSKNQYYLSTSASSLSGGSWSNSVPSWTSGKYIWTRIATTKTFADNSSATTYSDAIYDSNLTTALSTANTANSTANGALGSSVSVYYRSTSSSTPSVSSSTSIGTADDTDNAWSYLLPKPKSGRYFFTAERYTQKGGTVAYSAVRQMSNLTVSSLWCSANNSTYIDGGHIYASSVTANQIASGAITADKIAAGAIVVGKIADGAVSNAKVASSAITTVKIADGAITAAKITANAVTADKINVSDLQAIGATIGGWAIDSTSIHTNNVAITSNADNSFGLSSSTFTRTLGVGVTQSISGLKMAIGKRFGVTNTGVVYASGLYTETITGLNTGSGRGFTLNGWAIRNAYNNGEYGYSITSSNKTKTKIGIVCDNTGGITIGRSDNNGSTWYDLIGCYASNGNVTAVSWTTTSDRRLKNSIAELDTDKCAEFIYSLKPCQFRYNHISDELHHGFIAQDVDSIKYDNWDVVTKNDVTDSEGSKTDEYLNLAYTELIADMVATLQKQHKEIEELKARIA